MADLAHYITEAEAELVRRIADGELAEEVAPGATGEARIFLPIEVASPPRRPACRLCGDAIAPGVDGIRFQFDPHATPDGSAAAWGRLRAAWIHRQCTTPEEETHE